jgi:hypothetical protein
MTTIFTEHMFTPSPNMVLLIASTFITTADCRILRRISLLVFLLTPNAAKLATQAVRLGFSFFSRHTHNEELMLLNRRSG